MLKLRGGADVSRAQATTPAEWLSALGLMRQALSVLDKTEAPPDIGAHLDLAICRLEDAVADEIPTGGAFPVADAS